MEILLKTTPSEEEIVGLYLSALLRNMLVNLISNKTNTTNKRSMVNILLLDLSLFVFLQ